MDYSPVVDFKKELGSEPDANRGVALEKPLWRETQTEAREPEEKKEEIAEGQQDLPVEGQEQQEGTSEGEPESIEAEQVEGHSQKLTAKEFASQADWSLEEFYRDVTVPTDDGEVTLSEVVDGYKALRAENEQLQQERQHLESKATQTQQPMQQYAPRAVELMTEVQQLQNNYDAATTDGTFDNMEAAEALSLRMKYRDAIDQRTRAAQHTQSEYQVEYQKWAKDLEVKIDAEIREMVPEFRNPRVRAEQTGAMNDMLRTEYGVDDGRWNGMQRDPLSMKLIHDLWSLKAKQAAIQRGVKKVVRVPKALSPAARQGKAATQSAKDVGKAISSAKSRREQDNILFSSEFDDSLLGKR